MADMLGAGAGGPTATNRRVILWFRRDLRLADNPALVAALRMAPEVVPVYLWSPEEEGQFQPGRCSRWWLHKSLEALDRDLRALGSRLLCFRAANSRAQLARVAATVGAQAVLFNHLYDPISMVRDNEVKAGLAAAGVFCQSFNGDILREPWDVLDARGQPFTCYDAFWTAHCALPLAPPPPLPLPGALPPLPAGLEAAAGAVPLGGLGIMSPEEEMSNAQLDYHWQPGSAGAHRVLAEFVGSGRLGRFDRDRARTDRASTSRLSPHIHYGEISVRHIHFVARQKEAEWAFAGHGGTAVDDFLRQLGYREYSRYLSFHFPFTHERSLLEHLRAVPWRFDQRLFKAWRQGRTGYPLVDAAMREVWSTGWMHNRMRVVAASFMVKNLLLPWQWGLKHYWDALLDADLECDALGWQYVAGCMADAHDFSTLIDQRAEAQRFDPDGHYVRRWLPVLARLPARHIHEPWLAPQEVLEDAGVELGLNYPFPVIGLEESLAALHAANAVVQQCLRDGCPPGPFRPATHADPEEAERLFEENYRSELLYGPTPAPAARVDLAEGCGTTEDVESNLVAAAEADLVSSCVPQWGGRGGASRVAAVPRKREASPSAATATAGTATNTGPLRASTAAAASAAPPLPAQLPQGKRLAAELERAPLCLASEGAASQAGPPSAAGFDRRVPTGSCQPGSSAALGASGGPVALAGRLAGGARLPSCEVEAETVARMPAGSSRAAAGQAATATLRQGSSSPGGITPASSALGPGAGEPPAAAERGAPASLKRLRAGSPPAATCP